MPGCNMNPFIVIPVLNLHVLSASIFVLNIVLHLTIFLPILITSFRDIFFQLCLFRKLFASSLIEFSHSFAFSEFSASFTVTGSREWSCFVLSNIKFTMTSSFFSFSFSYSFSFSFGVFVICVFIDASRLYEQCSFCNSRAILLSFLVNSLYFWAVGCLLFSSLVFSSLSSSLSSSLVFSSLEFSSLELSSLELSSLFSSFVLSSFSLLPFLDVFSFCFSSYYLPASRTGIFRDSGILFSILIFSLLFRL